MGKAARPRSRTQHEGSLLLGRTEERSALRAGLDSARAGRGSCFLVIGEAGMGKSRLVEETTEIATSEGMRVLVGRSAGSVDVPAYWPWIQVLRQVSASIGGGRSTPTGSAAADIPPLISEILGPSDSARSEQSPGTDRFAFFDAVGSFLKESSGAQASLIVMEDLHAADEPSLLLLRFMAQLDRGSGLMFLGTYDHLELRNKPGQRRLLTEIGREGRQLWLRGFDDGLIRELYEAKTGQQPSDAIASALLEASEGNPLYVEEAIRMLTKRGDIRRPDNSVGFRVPEGIRDLIRHRLSGLDDDVVELLSVASVIGREFEVSLLERVVGIEVYALLDLLGAAIEAEVISESSALGGYHFEHILIRETLYEDLTAARRMRLHRAVAEILEHEGPERDDRRLSELAHHWFKAAQAGDPQKAMTHTSDAARRALSRRAYEEAARLFQRALKVSDAAGASREEIDELRAGLAAAREAAKPSEDAEKAVGEISTGCAFVREGEYWTISYAGQDARLRDLKGLRYIAQLLKAPGRESHVLDLVASVEGVPSTRTVSSEDSLRMNILDDAGPMLDAKAKSDYKKRLMDLQEDLQEAEDFNDPERVRRAHAEIDALTQQLAASVGLGGRDRRAASQSEKARVNVTKSVKDALRRIDEHHEPLGRHLRVTIRTGTYCSYQPDPSSPITWEVRS